MIDSFESIISQFAFFAIPQVVESNFIPFVALTEHYGKVQIHEHGLRSEYAKVVGTVSFRDDLTTFDVYKKISTKAADQLGVPLYGSKIGQEMIDYSLLVNGL